jgi:hypothetical protein
MSTPNKNPIKPVGSGAKEPMNTKSNLKNSSSTTVKNKEGTIVATNVKS